MEEIEKQIARWAESLPRAIDVKGLRARCEISHKWKATYRSFVIREAAFWRMYDLGQQIVLLAHEQHILGARILLRSAIETLAILIYLNQKAQAVLSGKLSFFKFDDTTMLLLMGSRNEGTSKSAINILTVLDKAKEAYPGLLGMHEHLSESAHPNYDGVLYGYSETNPEEYKTVFDNRWVANFGSEQEPATAFVLSVFEHEYNDVWPKLMDELEIWLRENDEELENQRIASNH